tara:strand:+ start:83102 stop:83782 length:681 start_codon:yes stop_codon:yes gene_type:complete
MTTVYLDKQIEEALRDADPQTMLERAELVATLAHEGQTRSGGEPYITHPAAVVDILRNEFGIRDENILVTAWLHDVVEDCDGIFSEHIEKWFGVHVRRWIHQLSNDNIPKDCQPLKKATVKAALQHYKAAVMDEQAVWVKAADRLHNMRSLENAKWHSDAKLGYARDGVLLVNALTYRFFALTGSMNFPLQLVVHRQAKSLGVDIDEIMNPIRVPVDYEGKKNDST